MEMRERPFEGAVDAVESCLVREVIKRQNSLSVEE
jgi:hypothetical protein